MVISGVLLGNVLAQTASDIQYPVKELGNCQNEASCRVYCDKPQNLKVCLNFAEKNNLMSAEELQRAKKFLVAGGKGPGGCVGKDSCEEYCNDISHIDECISFAEKNNLIPAEELAEAKKVQAAIKRGVKPPPCGNKKQCDVYCSETEHMEECVTFGIEAGFIQGEELEDVQKMLAAIKRGIKPPPCKGKQACDEYCSSPDHMEVCMNFAMEAGFMGEQEKADAQKMLQALKKGIKPPACKGKEECDVYCAEESHFEECIKFAAAAGFMSPEDVEMARKTGGKGPGGCKGKEECENFCNNPDNQEICFNFAKEHDLIPAEDLERMKEGMEDMKEGLQMAPPEVLDCLKSKIGSDILDKVESGNFMPTPAIGDAMRICFEQFMPRGQMMERGGSNEGRGMGMPGGRGEYEDSEGMMPPSGFKGPGGCSSPDECVKYCSDSENRDKCAGFVPGGMGGGNVPSSGMPPRGMMPPEGMEPPEGMPSGGMAPPEGYGPPSGYPPPGSAPPGGYMPPSDMMPPAEMMPPAGSLPSSGEVLPPSSVTPPPSSLSPVEFLVGTIIGPFIRIFSETF